MFELRMVSHREISGELLEEVVSIKSKSWPFEHESQMKWMKKNLQDHDIHALLYLNESIAAYLNIIIIDIKIDATFRKCYGIGNVCTFERNRGWGKEIISHTNNFLTSENKMGLLFCKETHVNFYNKNKWELINKKKLRINSIDEKIYTMMFNFDKTFERIEYCGGMF